APRLALAGARAPARLRGGGRERARGRFRGRARTRRRSRRVARADRRVRQGRLHARLPARRLRGPTGVHRGREAAPVVGAPQPEEIYERTKEEGERRLERPVLELVSTALAAGFDVVAGVVVLALLSAQLRHRFGIEAAHVFGAIGFGIGFVFIVVGRGELFTENFRVPIAGLGRRQR